MNKRLTAVAAIAVAGLLGLMWAPAAMAQQCEADRPVMFGDLDWDSARFHNHVARFILEHGYGCDTDALPGSTLPLYAGLGRGDLDVVMEVWLENVRESWEKLEAEGKVKTVGANFPDAVQGWFVPTYVIKGDPERGIEPMAPDLRTARDLARYKDLFTDPEEPDKGRFYNCILGWGCEKVNTKKLYAYGLADDFTNFRPGTGAALSAAIAGAYKRGKPVVAYYWGPTWVLGQFDLTMLEEPPYEKAIWDELTSDEVQKPEQACAYPVVEVLVGLNTDFMQQAPRLTEFFSRYRTSNALTSQALAYMEENKGATAEDAAINFLRTQQELWQQWVPAAVVQRVREAL